MTKHMSVMVYQDPLTRQKPEGHAKLVKKLSSAATEDVWEGYRVERWLVEFKNEKPVERAILSDKRSFEA